MVKLLPAHFRSTSCWEQFKVWISNYSDFLRMSLPNLEKLTKLANFRFRNKSNLFLLGIFFNPWIIIATSYNDVNTLIYFQGMCVVIIALKISLIQQNGVEADPTDENYSLWSYFQSSYCSYFAKEFMDILFVA